MKVSVIIPTYNEEEFIEKCLESLKRQQKKADEIIVVDNNSTDRTVEIANKYNVIVIKEPKQGIIAARNCGFNEAKHEIMARIDADVIVPPDWIKKIKKNFSTGQIDALSGPVIFYDLPLSASYYTRFYLFIMKITQRGKETMIGPNMALTKKIWQKIKNDVCLNDKKVHEDIDLAIHINKAGGIIKIDKNLTIKASGRRINSNPQSFFIEYPIRAFQTIFIHK